MKYELSINIKREVEANNDEEAREMLADWQETLADSDWGQQHRVKLSTIQTIILTLTVFKDLEVFAKNSQTRKENNK